MATAEDYAKWIVDNQDKQGTPEFETVAQAYKIARAGTPAEAQTSPAPIEQTKADFGDVVGEGVKQTWQSFMQGGPMYAALTAMKYYSDEANKAYGKLAYEAGGKVTDIAAGAGASPEVSAGLGLATNVGIQAAPAIIGGKLAEVIAKPAMEAGSGRLMSSALKPVLGDWQKGKAAAAIQTMLDEGINVTPGGVRKLQGLIEDLNREVAATIANSPGTVIDKQAVYGPVKQTLDRFMRQVNPSADVHAINRAWQEFVNHPLTVGNTTGLPMPAHELGQMPIPVQLAQELKQGTYQALGNKAYGELKGAEIEAQKAIARGLKDEIARVLPEVRPLNAQESELINALNLTERRVMISANKNPMGLALLTKSPTKWAAFMADRSELFKSLVARMMHSGSERIPQIAGAAAQAAYQSQNRE